MFVPFLIVFSVFSIGIFYTYYTHPWVPSVRDIKNRILSRSNLKPVPVVPVEDRIIVTSKGFKYDVTDFISKHPGGEDVLKNAKGLDVEKLMLENDHSENAYKIMEKYRID